MSEATLRRVAPHKVRWQQLSADARRRLLEPVVSPEFHGAVEPTALERSADTATAGQPAPLPPRRTLEVRLVRGSIVEANARALVLGVFSNVDPSGPAAAIDAALGGAIREFTLRRMFAAQLGQVFVMPVARRQLLADFVLFAGLGQFDDFDTGAPAFVAENIVRTFARAEVEDFATVLFGTGSGVPVALALEQQLRGFIAGIEHADPGRVIRRISICEIDARKYAALVRAARKLAAEQADDSLALVLDEVQARPKATTPRRRRPARRGAAQEPAYLLVTTTAQGRADMSCRSALLTAGAKAAVLSGEQRIARLELEALLAPLESGRLTARDLGTLGTRLARLLLPASVREGLAAMQAHPLAVVHDREAARVPWEVLRIANAHPALGAGLSRRYASDALTVARWREDRAPGGALRMLLVADPTGDLPGAAAEGAALQQRLARAGVALDTLSGREATRARILAALASGAYDVLHYAGHAWFDARDPARGGLVCAGRDVLRGADLETVGNLPALVFCNACEAARVRRAQPRARRRTVTRAEARRAAPGMAEAFLAGGVANFLGTHWPVGDDSALEFSRTLYDALLAGTTLGAAVHDARARLAALPSLDWADYVHYGNTEFRLAGIP